MGHSTRLRRIKKRLLNKLGSHGRSSGQQANRSLSRIRNAEDGEVHPPSETHDVDTGANIDQYDEDDDYPGDGFGQIVETEVPQILFRLFDKHHINGKAQDDILRVFSEFKKGGIPFPSSIYKLKRRLEVFVNIKYSLIVYCSACKTTREDRNSICECQRKCPNVSPKKFDNYIYGFSLADSLQNLFSKNELNMRKPIEKKQRGQLRNITDGRIFRRIHNKCFPTLSLIINYDDASCFKSEMFYVCPIAFALAELPPFLRNKRGNIYLSGLWVGRSKPDTDILWNYGFLKEFNTFSEGFLKLKCNTGTDILFSIKIFHVICDKPAKAKTFNHIAFNGKYGCTKCCHPGTVIPDKNGRGNHRVYEYHPRRTLRMKQDYERYARIAGRTRKPYKGIRGPSLFGRHLRLPDQIPIDIMHSTYGGVVKRLLSETMTLYLPLKSIQFNQLSMRYRKLKVPHDFHRKPRNVNCISKWKSSEFKNFILYYVPIFRGLLPSDIFCLYMILSTFMRILTGPFITQFNLNTAKVLSELFYRYYEKKFGIEACTSNIHDIIHLPHQVLLSGPLTNSSVFVFEDFIYYLKGLVHGTGGYGDQIVKSYLISKGLNVTQHEVKHSKLFEDICLRKRLRGTKKFGNCEVIPPFTRFRINPRVVDASRLQFSVDRSNYVSKCSRVIIDNTMFHSLCYKNMRNSCSYLITFTDDEHDEFFAEIEYFVLPAYGHSVHAVVKPYKYLKCKLFKDSLTEIRKADRLMHDSIKECKVGFHFKSVTLLNKSVVINVDQITSKAIRVLTDDCVFVTKVDTQFESN